MSNDIGWREKEQNKLKALTVMRRFKCSSCDRTSGQTKIDPETGLCPTCLNRVSGDGKKLPDNWGDF